VMGPTTTREPAPTTPVVRATDDRVQPPVSAGLGNQAALHRATFAETLGPGAPLDSHTRLRMESAFSESFGHVRIHDGPEAAAANRRLSAQALTVGDHIAFAPGNYRPGTPVGDAMLAHELAHTIQQADANPLDAPALEASGSPLEADAEVATAGALGGLWSRAGRVTAASFGDARPALRSGLRVQRCGWGPTHPAADGKIGFQSCGFGASVGPGLLFGDKGDFIAVGSQVYEAHGDARAMGAPDDVARRWQLGFAQTELTDEVFCRYGERDAGVPSTVFFTPGAHVDCVRGTSPPWYDRGHVRTFGGADSKESASMSDQPSRPPKWHKGNAPLVATDGKSTFCSWLIVRHSTTGELVPLNWDTWEVNWGARFNAATRRGTALPGGGAQVTDSGEGWGPATPVLSGALANDSFRVREE
jgi:hypothetical protein